MAGGNVKIVITLGPASSDIQSITKLMSGGAEIFRLNLSHGDEDYFRKTVLAVRYVGKKLGKDFTIFFDLPGPKLRTGILPAGKLQLNKGEVYSLGPKGDIPVSKEILRGISLKNKILLSDGKIELKPLKKEGLNILVRATDNALLLNKQSINSRSLSYESKYPTKKDIDGIKFGKSLGIKTFAISFPSSAKDVLSVRKVLGKGYNIIAKIERAEAVRNFDEIATVSDVVMVARGDLGLNIDIAELPEVQRKLISRSNQLNKPVILATQVLESMTQNPMPTRAEVNDAFSSIFEGADSLMLSEETAIGLYPIRAFQMLKHVISRFTYPSQLMPTYRIKNERDAMMDAVTDLSKKTKTRDVLLLTRSGEDAFRLSRYRAGMRIFALTDFDSIADKLRFGRDVIPVVSDDASRLKKLTANILKKRYGLKNAILVNDMDGAEDISIYKA